MSVNPGRAFSRTNRFGGKFVGHWRPRERSIANFGAAARAWPAARSRQTECATILARAHLENAKMASVADAGWRYLRVPALMLAFVLT